VDVMNTTRLFQDFERDGLVLVEGLMTGSQLAAARAGVAWAMEQPPAPYKWIKQRTYEWRREHPIFVELIEHPTVLELAEAVLGPDFHLIAAQCSRNTRDDPYAPGAMVMHSDAVFFPTAERRRDDVPNHRYGFSAMWYVQDTPLEMGPTELVPGSHLSDEVVDNDTVDKTTLFSRSVPAGSLLVFNHRTRHRGVFNTSATPRDLITNAYARREVEKVQLTTAMEDGSQRFVVPEGLLPEFSPVIRELLH